MIDKMAVVEACKNDDKNIRAGIKRGDKLKKLGVTMNVMLDTVARERHIVGEKAAGHDAAVHQAATGTILVMDDDEIIREVLGKMLTSGGYTVLFATEGREAIALYSQCLTEGKTVDCLILDLTISGGMGGKNAMEGILRLDPRAKGIVSSGYAGDPVMTDYQKYGFAGAISKPFSMGTLLAAIRKVLTAKQN